MYWQVQVHLVIVYIVLQQHKTCTSVCAAVSSLPRSNCIKRQDAAELLEWLQTLNVASSAAPRHTGCVHHVCCSALLHGF